MLPIIMSRGPGSVCIGRTISKVHNLPKVVINFRTDEVKIGQGIDFPRLLVTTISSICIHFVSTNNFTAW